MEKVPESILLSMIRATPKDQLEWTIEDFIAALEKEVKVRESHMLLRHQPAASSSSETTAAATRDRHCNSERHAKCQQEEEMPILP